jgi:zinc protease
LQLATDGLVDRLRLKLREELGATYAPNGDVNRNLLQRDFDYAWVQLTFEPKQVKTMIDRVIKVADELARRGLTKEEFARLREPRRVQAGESLRSNEWWLNQVLLTAQTQPAVLDDARSLSSAFTELTRDEVNRAAASHFRAERSNIIGVSP